MTDNETKRDAEKNTMQREEGWIWGSAPRLDK